MTVSVGTLIIGGTIGAFTGLAMLAALAFFSRKPCKYCVEGYPVIHWGAGHRGHHRKDGQLIECGSLRPVTMREDT
jgi:hypothetical protein